MDAFEHCNVVLLDFVELIANYINFLVLCDPLPNALDWGVVVALQVGGSTLASRVYAANLFMYLSWVGDHQRIPLFIVFASFYTYCVFFSPLRMECA